MEQVPTWNDYLAFLRGRSSLVKDDQRRMRRLDETLGRVAFAVDDDRADVLPLCFRWKSHQMLETLGLDTFADERNRRFFLELRAAGLLNASTLRAGDRLLAAWLTGVGMGGSSPTIAIRHYAGPRWAGCSSTARLRKAIGSAIGNKWFFATHARMIAPLGTPPLRLRVRRVDVATLKAFPWLERRVRALRDRTRPLP